MKKVITILLACLLFTQMPSRAEVQNIPNQEIEPTISAEQPRQVGFLRRHRWKLATTATAAGALLLLYYLSQPDSDTPPPSGTPALTLPTPVPAKPVDSSVPADPHPVDTGVPIDPLKADDPQKPAKIKPEQTPDTPGKDDALRHDFEKRKQEVLASFSELGDEDAPLSDAGIADAQMDADTQLKELKRKFQVGNDHLFAHARKDIANIIEKRATMRTAFDQLRRDIERLHYDEENSEQRLTKLTDELRNLVASDAWRTEVRDTLTERVELLKHRVKLHRHANNALELVRSEVEGIYEKMVKYGIRQRESLGKFLNRHQLTQKGNRILSDAQQKIYTSSDKYGDTLLTEWKFLKKMFGPLAKDINITQEKVNRALSRKKNAEWLTKEYKSILRGIREKAIQQALKHKQTTRRR